MADPQPTAAGRQTIRIAQVLLVASAVGLWAASRLAWVDLRTFDGLSPPKLTTLSGAAWSSALLPLALVLLATAVVALVGSKRYYPGPVITLVTGVCALIGAVLLMRAATSARGTATKYLTPAARRSAATRDDGPMSERMIWDELDEGRDPTESSSPNDNPPAEPHSEGR